MTLRQPTLPRILPHFTATAPHHDTEYKLPPSLLSTNVAYRGEEWREAGENGINTGAGQACNQQPGNHGDGASRHERSASGYTTLVGTPSPTKVSFATVQPQHQQHQQTQQTQGQTFHELPPESSRKTPPATVPHGTGSSKVSWGYGAWAVMTAELPCNEPPVAELDGECRGIPLNG
ncbi:hypothetical protein VTH06DRAFT_428 [Thermothelomyces fergusii]